MTDIKTLLEAEIGKSYQSGWMTVDQPMIDRFADLTHDWNFIHVDAEKAAETPYGSTIAHGFLLLSLLAPLRSDCPRPGIPGLRMGVNYGFERVRFVSAVKSGSRVRGTFTVVSVGEKGRNQFLEEMDVSVEIESEERPAVVARWLSMFFF
jgi:acyl dehydratase